MASINVVPSLVKLGDKFSRWTVIGNLFKLGKSRVRLAPCECQCGNKANVSVYTLLNGKSKSCGCFQQDTVRIHGDSQKMLYRVWGCMITRCTKQESSGFQAYGARGITVCQEWLDSFKCFEEWALKTGYDIQLQIDRRDNDKGYSPENCRWVTGKVNCRNRRNNVIVEAFGEKKTIAEWAEDCRCRVKYILLWGRISKGWPIELAISKPSGTKGIKVIF